MQTNLWKGGAKVRGLRNEAGLTQRELAELAGVANETVSRIERGRLIPSLDLLTRLANALRVQVGELVGEAKKAPKSKLRPSEAKLLAVVRTWEEVDIEDLVRALKLVIKVAAHQESKK